MLNTIQQLIEDICLPAGAYQERGTSTAICFISNTVNIAGALMFCFCGPYGFRYLNGVIGE